MTAAVTIQDVAKRAEVSAATVSLVLQNRGRIRRQTRERVEEAIRQLGYRRKPAGRPKAQQTRHIAVIFACASQTTKPTSPTVLREWFDAVRRALSRQGHRLSFFGGHRHVDDDVLMHHVSDADPVDGAILLGVNESDGYVDWALSRRIPSVVINRRPVRDEFSSVVIDAYRGGWLAAEHLLRCGHEKIAVLNRADMRAPWYQARLDGFNAALHTHGLKILDIQDVPEEGSEYVRSQMEPVCRALVDTGATAVFATASRLALPAVDMWVEQGVSVPNELAVIGHDDVDTPTQSGLRLTTVGVEADRVAYFAAKLMIEKLQYPHEVQNLTVTLASRLVERDTTVARGG